MYLHLLIAITPLLFCRNIISKKNTNELTNERLFSFFLRVQFCLTIQKIFVKGNIRNKTFAMQKLSEINIINNIVHSQTYNVLVC